MRVFIVDDERIIREGLCRMVRRLGEDWSVVGTAANGGDAIDQMSKIGPVDLLITDVRMPVMNGLQLISKIRDQWPSMNIIVLSGYNDFEYIRHALLNRVSDYLLKPIKMKIWSQRWRKSNGSGNWNCNKD